MNKPENLICWAFRVPLLHLGADLQDPDATLAWDARFWGHSVWCRVVYATEAIFIVGGLCLSALCSFWGMMPNRWTAAALYDMQCKVFFFGAPCCIQPKLYSFSSPFFFLNQSLLFCSCRTVHQFFACVFSLDGKSGMPSANRVRTSLDWNGKHHFIKLHFRGPIFCSHMWSLPWPYPSLQWARSWILQL